jgi:integrase
MCTGMRISEIIGLRVADINFTEGIITVKQQLDRENNPKEKLKTESSYRQIDFLPELFEGIDLSGEYVFQGMSYTATRSYFRRLFEKLKLEFVLHSFRHTFISNCYYVGIRDKQIQLWAGHSKVEITINTYTHIIKGDSPFIDYVRKLKQRLEVENRP